MSQAWKKLVPVVTRRYALQPSRTFFSRRSSLPLIRDWNLHEIERGFDQMEREMNRMFDHFASPFFYRPSSSLFRLFSPTEAITETSDGKSVYKVRLDLGEKFTPENVKVTLKGHTLTIDAKVEQKAEDGSSRHYQEITRQFTLPENIKADEVKSLFTPDGILIIEATLPEQLDTSKPKEIPVTIEKE